MATVALNAAQRYAHIDALRAIAVMIVVIGHAGIPMMPGDAGVTIFFVISGFIITHLLLRERESTGCFNVGRFYARRFLKLGPPFLVLIFFPTLVFAIWQTVNFNTVASQVLFTYNWAQILWPETAMQILPGSNVTWSLAVEEQFYILFAIIWMLFVDKKYWRPALATLAGIAIVVAPLIRFGVMDSVGDAGLRIVRGTDTRMDSIAWGILAALVYKMWRDQQHIRLLRWVGEPWTLPIAAVLFLGTFVVRGEGFALTWRYTIQSVLTAVIILYGLTATPGRMSALVGRVSASKIVTLVGLSSYSIYLVHDVLIFALKGYLAGLPAPLAGLLLVLIGVGVGIASYFAIERPVLAFRQKRQGGQEMMPAPSLAGTGITPKR